MTLLQVTEIYASSQSTARQNNESAVGQPRYGQASPHWQDSPERGNTAERSPDVEASHNPMCESLDTFSAMEGFPGGVLDLEAAAALPDKEMKAFMQGSQLDRTLIPSLRKVRLYILALLNDSARSFAAFFNQPQLTYPSLLCILSLLSHR